MTSLFSAPISTDAPLAMFPRRDNHPVSRAAIVGVADATPVQTNKWYSNLFLGTQTQGAWSLPYMLYVSKDVANWGLCISHTEANQLGAGPDASKNPFQYYISPLGIRSFTFSATEFSDASSITLGSPTAHSVDLNLHANRGQYGDATKKIQFPLVQGMGFVTARYTDLVPVLGSGVLFRTVTAVTAPRDGLQKWRVLLEDGKTWLLYACPAAGTASLSLSLSGNSKLVGSASFTGFIQVAKLSDTSLESVIDSAAGAFPTTTTLSGSVSGTTGTYSLSHTRFGTNNAGKLLMYALKHHQTSFDAATNTGKTNLLLLAPTKGLMRGYLADTWTMVEPDLPTATTWLPNNGANMSAAVIAQIKAAATTELQQDMQAQSNLDSMYFSGKALAKFAQIVLALSITQADPALARSGLTRLQEATGRFTSNVQQYPLVYDRTWRGLVSDALYKTGDPGYDFGNSYYNDHHFHYGYFIYTAAVIGYCERILNNNANWINANKPWVNSLVRDVANPHVSDKYFPVSRSFDYFHGHSWAKGLFESADGKDEESSSEDYNFAYSMKLWGMMIGNAAMEARGNLMLGIMKRSMNEYMLMSSGNTIHPAGFIKNKVTGILFENKVDHATYFGLNPEYIQGIHMIPLSPVSPYIRSAAFCQEEWNQWFSNTSNINDGWKGILYANVALFNPRASWQFFTQGGFNAAWIDGGASRTWYLAFAGCMFHPDFPHLAVDY
ncbi:endo-1,3(4)-beta-glucanase [Geopyxis carbonaria]|nr:endo-1,3(4)-beta-glucanase [Geopyxis carbonaria]